MNMKLIALAVAVAGLSISAVNAAPKDNSWYVGGKVGWSHYSSSWVSKNVVDNENKYNLDDKEQWGAGAFAGYQYNEFFGFEMGYDWLGRMNSTAHFPSGESYRGKYDVQGVQLTTRLSYPIMQDLDIYTRLGGFAYRAKASYRDRTVDGSGESWSKTNFGVSPLAAAGVEYALNDDWALRLDYQWIWKLGDKSASELGMRPNNSLLSVGGIYRFGRAEHAAPAPAPTPAPAPQVSRFTLTSDVLFTFNKASLKTEGRQALDQLYNQIHQANPESGTAVVIGYTDRLGSEHYNLRLSEERARSVMDYLVSKGIPADRISARGMGKENPTTGTTCDGVHNRHALIECLAPDRRVEIEVTGTKQGQ